MPELRANPIDPRIGVPLNTELQRRGLELELHRLPGPRALTVIRFHVAGVITKTAIAASVDANELGLMALEILKRGKADGG